MAGHECDDLLHELADFLHGDVSEAKRQKLESHIQDCPPCFETADFQAQLRQIVAKRCCEEVPDDLRAKVTAMLSVEFRDGSGAS